MADNLTSAKTFRQYAAIEGRNHPPIHPNFIHEPPDGDAISPNNTPAFTAVASTDLLNTVGHGLAVNTPIVPSTTGTLPGGLTAATTVYVIASGLTADAFKVSATVGGSAIDITSAGTGTHSWQRVLTDAQKTEIQNWRNYKRGALPYPPATTDSVVLLTVAAWDAYDANPQHKAWEIDDYIQLHAQWAWRVADHFDAASAATPPSGSSVGTGGGGAHSPVPVSVL
jgi:hypothetical protein